jgi:hypothetical protein
LLHNGMVLPPSWPSDYGVSSETGIDRGDFGGKAFSHFSEGNCRSLRVDSTLAHVAWRGSSDLSDLAGEELRFRFILRDGRLYSFWVSPDESGARNGYVAAGGLASLVQPTPWASPRWRRPTSGYHDRRQVIME